MAARTTYLNAHPRRRRAAILSTLLAWDATFRQRTRLRDLTDMRLRDIGLTRDEVDHERAKPFWDAPDHWKR